MTITISENVEPSMIDNLLKYMQREKVPYAVQTDDDEVRTAAIKERLRQKFVVTGEWTTMDDEDRLDAALFEGMMYDNEQAPVEYHSAQDSRAFYKNQKKQNHAI
jgi:hypothetical protein